MTTESPERVRLREEDQRINALADLLGQHDRILTPFHYRAVAGRLAAYKHDRRVTDLLGSPVPPIHRELQQQQTNRYDDQDAVLERLAEIEAERGLLYGYLRAMGSPHADGYDPELRGEREDDRRISQERADAAAAAGMPKVAS